MKKFLDTDHPFFRPLWTRVLFTALPLGWAVLEFTTGAPFWGMIFLALGVYAGYNFFFVARANPDPARPRTGDEPPQQ